MSSTHYEAIGDDLDGDFMSPGEYKMSPGEYKVCIQHCEHKGADGVVCDEYLGVNYPSSFCFKHERFTGSGK